jgi:predicted transcriptional regulator
MAMPAETNLTELTAIIVACFVSNNPLTAIEVPAFISSTHAALLDIDSTRTEVCRRPAVPVDESITEDYLVCLNDGQKVRALKRYLQRKYAMSPEQYRKMWGLPKEYPMVAPSYSALRSKIAKKRAHG